MAHKQQAQGSSQRPRVLNVNVGVLGHVDSGKTSLVAALSTKLSTAALDKHPQSKERGITLDLGFSSFSVPMPSHLAHLPYDELQFTLVDCPGHASLIRTIIGGVQIIDMAVLVVDIVKGMQVQTAECLVVGEVATNNLVVVLNKVDLLPEEERPKLIRKAAKRLAATFNMTKFAGVTMIPVAAKPGGGGTGQSECPEAQGIDTLRAALLAMVSPAPRPPPSGPLLFSIDHCFPVKGQGTVLTGTVLQGSLQVGEMIELPTLKLTKQVKSMQMFKQPVSKAVQGDRVGVCVTQLDAKIMERGVACTPGTVPTFSTAIAAVERIRFYAGKVPSKAKFHISVGHTTVMAELTFLGLPEGQGVPVEAALAQMVENLAKLSCSPKTPDSVPMTFDTGREYLYQEELYGLEGRPCAESAIPQAQAHQALGGEDPMGNGAGGAPARHYGPQWVLLRFEQPVTAPKDALVIGAKFDVDIHGDSCRLAFYGRLVRLVDATKPAEMALIRAYKVKEKQGVIERILPDQNTAIVRGMFKKETDPQVYLGLKVTTGLGEEGIIESSFGKSGKLKITFAGGLNTGPRTQQQNLVLLRCKRYIYDAGGKRLKQ